GLGFGRYFQFYATIKCWHFQFTAERCIDKIDRHFAVQVGAVALKDTVLTHIHLHIQVATWAAICTGFTFTGKTNAIAGIHTRRYFYRQGFSFLYAALAMTGFARVRNNGAAPATAGTSLLHREKALLHAHLAVTATGGTGNGFTARFCA